MSEINFKEIEKAMAELVNKTQGQKREEQLVTAVKKRDQITKKKEDKIGQGRVATKRIIIGNKGLRANLNPARTNLSTNMPASTARNNPISDFRPPSPRPTPLPSPEEEESDDAEQYAQPLDQSVGSLSDEYLVKEVAQSYEPEFTNKDESDNSASDDSYDNSYDNSENAESDQVLESSEVAVSADSTSPFAAGVQQETSPSVEDKLPESEELSKSLEDDPSYDRGAVHRMYGQKMPTDNIGKFSNKEDEPAKKEEAKTDKAHKDKRSHKHGFLFFLVCFLVFASIVVWGVASYLYFLAK